MADTLRNMPGKPWSNGLTLEQTFNKMRSLMEVMRLSETLNTRFADLGRLEDLNNVIHCHRLAMFLVSNQQQSGLDLVKPSLINNCGNAYLARFERLGELADISKAIQYHAQAVRLTRDDHAHKSMWLYNLGSSYLARFKQLGEVADIDKTIQYQAQAMALTPRSDPERPARLNALGCSYNVRFNHSGEISDVDRSIEYLRQAVQFTPDGHADKSDHLDNLGSSYRDRFRRNGEVADFDRAVRCFGQAMLLTPDSHVDRSERLSNIGYLYLLRFQRLGKVEDIEIAIDYHSRAVRLTPDGHEKKPARLNDLGNSYNRRFERLGELTDADEAVRCHRQALSLTLDDHARRAAWLNDLGISYTLRFDRLGEVADLEKAIDCLSQAVLLTPDGDFNKPVQLNNLGKCYIAQFRLSKELLNIEKAIRCLNQAVLLTPNGHEDRAARLNNLGSSYLVRFEHNTGAVDVDHAIKYQSQAVLLTPDGHPDKPFWLCNLGRSHRYRFEHNDKLMDIDKAVIYQSQAVQLTPDGHPDKPAQLDNLGTSYFGRFSRFGNALDLENATAAFAHAARFGIGSPSTRFRSARAWAMSSPLLRISPEPAYQRLMELVPEFIWLGSTIEQRYNHVAQIGDVAIEAAASAVSLRAFDRALEWLEQGRSVVWRQILQLRTPFDELSEANPVLAERLKEVGRKLEHAGSRSAALSSSLDRTPDLEGDAQDHHRLATEWDQLLEAVRLLPGFDSFMRPHKAKDLVCAARDGPVVVINVYSNRSDALIILPNSEHVAHVPLKDFSPEKAADARAQLLAILGSRGTRNGGFKRVRPVLKPEEILQPMLATLWSDVVKPILDFLGYTAKPPTDELPHVTWCTTGALSFLPLHAAGYYDGLQPNTPDLIVSSFTPTLSALLTPNLPSQSHAGILAIGQEVTKGHASLPYTVQELAIIGELTEGIRYKQLDGDNATTDAVLNTMEEYSWVHLACHASQNSSDPTRSAFHLHDGNLLLSEITKRSFKNKGLAFLSACQTATGDENLPEEAVHLAAGMLMAGYPSVIATMWAIIDEDAPEVSRQVYADLLQDGKMDHSRAARALHKAVAALREKIGENSFERWVPFVHIGS